MKYTKEQFAEVIECFDLTIRYALKYNKFAAFDCFPLGRNSCKKYCPLFGGRDFGECYFAHGAEYWQFAKEKFIIENEPQD